MSRTIQIYFKTLKLEENFQLVGFSNFAFFSFSDCFVRSFFPFSSGFSPPWSSARRCYSPERMPTPLLCFPSSHPPAGGRGVVGWVNRRRQPRRREQVKNAPGRCRVLCSLPRQTEYSAACLRSTADRRGWWLKEGPAPARGAEVGRGDGAMCDRWVGLVDRARMDPAEMHTVQNREGKKMGTPDCSPTATGPIAPTACRVSWLCTRGY
jgi:hypothetical protein